MNSRRVLDEAGQALLELALVLPLLLVLLVGIVEFAQAFNTKQAVTDAAREGARHAVVMDASINQDSVTSAVATALERAGIPSEGAAIVFNKTTSWRVEGQMQTVYVGVPYRFDFFGPLMKAVTGSETITIAGQVSMRNQP